MLCLSGILGKGTLRTYPPSRVPTVTIAIALAILAIAIVLAHHPCHRCNCPLHCLCLHSPATLVAITLPRGGEGRIIPIRCMVQLWLPPPVPTSLSPPLLPTQPAERGWVDDVQAFNARQMVCANVAGLP